MASGMLNENKLNNWMSSTKRSRRGETARANMQPMPQEPGSSLFDCKSSCIIRMPRCSAGEAENEKISDETQAGFDPGVTELNGRLCAML